MDGLGNLLSGLAGTTPNTATTVGASVTELTGVGAFASRSGWDAAMAQRLDAACEETLLTLVRQEKEEERRLRLVAYREGGGAVLEFVVASRDENVQDRLALLGDEPGEALAEEEVSLRLLRRLASSVRHRQYRGMDVVTVRVAGPGPAGGGET